MQLLIIYLGTVIGSIIIKIKNLLDLSKDIGDMGYKAIDNEYYSPKRDYSLLIPIYNLFKVLDERLKYKQTIDYFLNDLPNNPDFEPFNDIEAEAYLNKQTGLNALLVPIMYKRRLEKASVLEITKGDITGTVYYEISDEEFIVLEAKGEIAKLSVEEQEKLVFEYWQRVVYRGIKTYGGIEKLMEAMAKNPSLDLKAEDDEPEPEIEEINEFINETVKEEFSNAPEKARKLNRKR